MNIAHAYCSADRDQSVRWQEQIKKWGGLGQHRLFLLRAFGCEPIPEILPFTPLTDYAKVTSNWSGGTGNVLDSAAGPNSMWRMFARYFHANQLGPWFYCEPDCIPLFPDSLDRWEAEYLQAGKDFMGAFVDFPAPHLTGCAMYPESSPLYIDLILPHMATDKRREIAFDVAGGRVTVPNAHLTKSIQHVWRAPSFTSQADFDARVDSRALFYHANKDGSIYQFLGGGPADPASSPAQIPLDASASVPEQSGNGLISASLTPAHPNSPEQQNGAVMEPIDQLLGKFTTLEDPPRFTFSNGEFIPVSNGTTANAVNPAYGTPAQIRTAKARAALAAKRASGWKPGPRKKRIRRRAKAKA